MATASRLRTAILQPSRGGALPLIIDVNAVSHLSSAGVQLLHHLATGLGRLQVAAEPDSPAHAVLILTGLQSMPTRPARPAPFEAGRQQKLG